MAEQMQQNPFAAWRHDRHRLQLDENQHPDFGGLQLVMCDYAKSSSQPSAVSIESSMTVANSQ